MNPHDHKPDDALDEKRIAAALSASDADAAPVDAEFLARLRERSTAAFIGQGKRAVRTRKARWLGAVAAVVVGAVGLYWWLGFGSQGLALGEVLENSERAGTLHGRLSLSDKEMEFWHSSQLQRWRLDEGDGEYLIADAGHCWHVNEQRNEARRTTLPPEKRRPFFEILERLGVPGDNPRVLAARPFRKLREGGRNLLVYKVKVQLADGMDIELLAGVDAQSHLVETLGTIFYGDDPRLRAFRVIAYNEPIDPDKFVVADTLTADGRIGKVIDVQGLVTIKPVLHERWTPVREQFVLRPGDFVRTDARGANATALRLVKQTGIVLGPHSLVELIGPKKVRLIEGEVEIGAGADSTIELLGPGKQKITVKGKQLFRAEKEQLVRVEQEPKWLLGFKGTTDNDVLGSLVALVDGRNVPLSVGYHKVVVDIRDQIARTEIEESFVNHTDAQLEGVFCFPLPADASISGFGMWIGARLVEADVVEKQRAREIYETILHEKRDPGLLEWSGGNIFKARVFPILPHSEKRIKISYTQVLPLKGSRFRFSYALQSEMLQQHPLRELNIDVKVHSAVPLRSVNSATHPTRNDLTSHSAHVEFTAQEYTPTRDFEVDVEIEGKRGDVIMIPHRRGDDGYFMLQLTPPGALGDWDRSLLPNGEPLEILILADTSASIDAGQRATQATFIGALLAGLGQRDTVNLATCDVTCDWVFEKPLAADANNVKAARDFLAKRTSLGWTNLDVAFASALKQCGAKTQVIYVGDGIITNGDADPVAFAQRLTRLWHGRGQGRGGAAHAVSLGSSFEPAVLKAIAALGGGTMRKITSEQGPAMTARDLLGEVAQPALRDIKVEFKGIKVARLYPETLANIPAGTQQILLGRYLPQAKDQTGVAEGEVIVTGTQDGKPVRFSTKLSLKDAEQGNSFIPRLWARMHLDSLLDQGSSDIIRDEIIALSEEFQIITPFTSLLVLESDADRERFKVKRRFQMRDGERFFAQGRDNAIFDLKQKQMKLAGEWRTALRQSVLSELAGLGRDARLFQRSPYRYGDLGVLDGMRMDSLIELEVVKNRPADWDYFSGMHRHKVGEILIDGNRIAEEKVGSGTQDIQEQITELLGVAPLGFWLKHDPIMVPERVNGVPAFPGAPGPSGDVLFGYGSAPQYAVIGMGTATMASFGRSQQLGRDKAFRALEPLDDSGSMTDLARHRLIDRDMGGSGSRWLNTLFPPLRKVPSRPTKPKSIWPLAARDLAQSLLRKEQLAKMAGGIEIVRQIETFDAHWGEGELVGRARRLELISAKSWTVRSESDGGQTLVSWCDGKEVGIFSKAFQLGRLRAATPFDLDSPPLELNDYSLTSLEEAFAGSTATVQQQGKDRTLLVLKSESTPLDEMRILIDNARRVIVSIETRHKDKVTARRKLDDFVLAAGSWWAQRIETTDADGKRLTLVTQAVKTLAIDALEQQMKKALAGRDQVQFLHMPGPTVLEAKKALDAGKASFDDQVVLILHYARSEQWERVLDHLRQAEKLAAGKPGLRWLRSALLTDSRQHDELRQRYREDAGRLAKDESPDAYFLGEFILGQSSWVTPMNEMLTLIDTLRPLYERQPPHMLSRKHWDQWRLFFLGRTGRSDEVLRLQKQLAADYPRDYRLQQQYAQALASGGDYPAAYAWLTRVLAPTTKWRDQEEAALHNTFAGFLEGQGRFGDLATYLAGWIEQGPAGSSAYDQYLSALIKSDDMERAEALALGWLKEAQVAGELTPPMQGRLDAAVDLMLGNGHGLQTRRVQERWLNPLSQAVLFFCRREAHAATVNNIMDQQQFSQSEEAQKLRKQLAAILIGEIDKLSADNVRRLAGWVNADDAEPGDWEHIGDNLRQRWRNEAKDNVKHELGSAILRVLSRHERPNEMAAFLRLQLQAGPERQRATYANQLFDHLLQQPWSAEVEGETLGLLDKLSDAEEPGQKLFTSVAALHRLTDAFAQGRIAAGTSALVNPEKLTRIALRQKQEEIGQRSRAGLADRLRQEAAKHPKALGQWLQAESIFLDVTGDRNLKQAATDAWQFLGTALPPKGDEDPMAERALDDMLRDRYFLTLANLAARKAAEPALVERLLKYVDKEIDAESAEGQWKMAKSRLLVALDRTTAMEGTLRQWTRQDDADSRWRIALGYLLAEQGRLADAILQFEVVEAADELSPGDYRALSEWYVVQNQRDKHERAAAAVYQTTSEFFLRNMLAAKLQPWQIREGHLPTEVDKEVLRIFGVLFNKSAAPQYCLRQLEEFYQASHDFRLLACLPDAVVGHTAGGVYPFVKGMQSILGEVRDEATADEIIKRIGEVRPRAKTAVDLRALDLLEVLVERRAAELQNQPGPHREKALAGLVRASKGAWDPGEPLLMADFLASLGKIAQPALAEEQRRQLKALQVAAAAGSIDRLHIAEWYALTLNRYERRELAIDLLQTALDEFQAANKGVLPVSANDTLVALIRMHEEAGHFARGEKILLAQIENPVHAQQRRWLSGRLDELYYHAMQKDGSVSLGDGATLFKALEAKVLKGFANADQEQRYQGIMLLCDVFRLAHSKKLAGAVEDLKSFAFKVLPPLLKQQVHNRDAAVRAVANAVHDVAGPRDGIAFLLDQIESEPRWQRFYGQDGWSWHANQLSLWRTEAKELGAVEGRLLKLVLAELRRDLETRAEHNRAMYQVVRKEAHFWKEKAGDFAKTAEEVLAKRSQSPAAVQYIAKYFYWDLDDRKRAIEIMFIANNQKLLGEEGQERLVGFLHSEKRFGESIPVLQALVQRWPENIYYRVQLMHAYWGTGRKAELQALLKQTDAFFRAGKWWDGYALGRLAQSTLDNELFEQSVAYFKEVIPLHERTALNRGIGDSTLANYYSGLANAYAGLKDTPKAVEAAGGAIVAWGPRREYRDSALQVLRSVLMKSPDIDAFVGQFDKGPQDSAVVRKALGQVYAEKNELAKAIKQVELAAVLQPNDSELYPLLVTYHDALGDKEGAIRQLLQAVQHSRRDLKLYRWLGERYADLGQAGEGEGEGEAERAYTSMVEMLPTEAESHAMLAEIREKQKRWPEAISQWQHVSRLSPLEPTGFLKLAAAQIHEKQWDDARQTLRKLDTHTWPSRFGDVSGQINTLKQKIEKMDKIDKK